MQDKFTKQAMRNAEKAVIDARNKVGKIIEKRLREFRQAGKNGNNRWFSELCFCILTANSKAESAIAIQDDLGCSGFMKLPLNSLKRKIKMHKHRFHNVKAGFIVQARKFANLKNLLDGMSSYEAREWLVKNIKGIGYKEASHFLRNMGFFDVAILDRHILRFLRDACVIDEIPSLNRKNYLQIESLFNQMAERLNMFPGEMDLYVWYLKTGTVMK